MNKPLLEAKPKYKLLIVLNVLPVAFIEDTLSNMLLLETGIDLSAETIANIENNKRTLGDYEFLFLIKILEIDILNFSKKIIEEVEEEMKKQGYSY